MHHEISFDYSAHPIAMKLIWFTDLHLDAAEKERVKIFFEVLLRERPDAVLIGGDISNGVNSLKYLKNLIRLIGKPIYFVLGNHDYYYGSIETIRRIAQETANEIKTAHYLSSGGVMELTPYTALVGHDGWSDAREGDFLNSTVMLHDYLLIDELKDLSTRERMATLQSLGTEAAETLRKSLSEALTRYDNVIVLTHTPPFRESCLYEARVCDESWAPHFVCQAMGKMLLEEVGRFPEKEVLVLCGHSHHAADRRYLSNLRVLTGHSALGEPMVQGTIHIP